MAQAYPRLRLRRERRAARRAARQVQARAARRADRRAGRRARVASRIEARAARHVVFGADGTVATVEVDPARFEAALAALAALARFDAHPHDPGADRGDGADLAGTDVALLDDDCPLCRAIEQSQIGAPIPFGFGRDE